MQELKSTEEHESQLIAEQVLLHDSVSLAEEKLKSTESEIGVAESASILEGLVHHIEMETAQRDVQILRENISREVQRSQVFDAQLAELKQQIGN